MRSLSHLFRGGTEIIQIFYWLKLLMILLPLQSVIFRKKIVLLDYTCLVLYQYLFILLSQDVSLFDGIEYELFDIEYFDHYSA